MPEGAGDVEPVAAEIHRRRDLCRFVGRRIDAAVGDARLIGELVKRGIDREEARNRVVAVAEPETERIAAAYDRLRRAKSGLSYQSAARRLERLGFPASLIYRVLRERAGIDLGELVEESSA